MALPHVCNTTGEVLDVERVARAVRQIGATLLLDCAQSAGMLRWALHMRVWNRLRYTALQCARGSRGHSRVPVPQE